MRTPSTLKAAAAAAALSAACGCDPADLHKPVPQVSIFAVDREEFQNYGEVKSIQSGSVSETTRAAGGRPLATVAEWRVEWPSEGCGLDAAALAAARTELARAILDPLSGNVRAAGLPDSPAALDVISRIVEAASIAVEAPPESALAGFSCSVRTAVSWPFGLPEKGSAAGSGGIRGPVLGLSGLVTMRTARASRGSSATFAMNYSVPSGRRLFISDCVKSESLPGFRKEFDRRWAAVAGATPPDGGIEGFLVESDGLSWSDASGKIYLKLSWGDLEAWLK